MTGPQMPHPGQRKVPDQAERRLDLLIPDNHGRKMHVVFDRMPGAGPIIAYPQFTAPWLPEMKYLTYEGGQVPTSCRWKYNEVLADSRDAWDRWFGEFRTLAGRMPGVDAMASYSAAIKGDWNKVPPALLAELGSTPDPEDFVKAAMANNAWVLGLSPIVPDWAKPLVSLKESRRRAEVNGEIDDSELDKYRDADKYMDLEEELARKGQVGGTLKHLNIKPLKE